MSEEILTKAKADLKLNLMNAEAESLSSSDMYLWLIDSGLSSEVAIRLKNFADVTENVADHTISIGKIVLLKIVDIGIAVGAAIGALVSLIPFLGVYLAPVVASISATVGAIAGHRLDKIEQGQTVNTSTDIIAIGQDAIEIAKEFFKLLAGIFNAVFNEQVLSFRG
jgi:hypothetical protein